MSVAYGSVRFTWDQPICFNCFWKLEPGRIPIRVKEEIYGSFEEMIEVCAWCGDYTIERIYRRAAPEEVRYPKLEYFDEESTDSEPAPAEPDKLRQERAADAEGAVPERSADNDAAGQ